MSDYIIVGGELRHYGVKGMKWGVRRATHAKSVYAHKAQKQIAANKKVAKYADERIRSGRDSKNRRLTDSQISAYKKERDVYIRAAKEWTSARSDIMSMDVSKISAKDVKQRFKSAKLSAGGWFVGG